MLAAAMTLTVFHLSPKGLTGRRHPTRAVCEQDNLRVLDARQGEQIQSDSRSF